MRIVKDVTLDANGKRYVEIFGTSSESKPTQQICMGSCFIEVDTGKAFLSMRPPPHGWSKEHDMTTGEVIALIKAFGGSGGGSSGGGVLVVNLTESETGYTCDKTAAEIMDGVNNGAVIFKSIGEDFTDISYVIGVSYSEADGYTFGVLANGNNTQFYYTAASGTDYPSVTF